MNSNFWRFEAWRLTFVVFIICVCGLISKQWLWSIIFVLIGFISWLLFKLNQLYLWLKTGADPRKLPNGNGIWADITLQIQAMQKKSNQRKNKMGKLLKRSQTIISGLPYAAIILNKYNEIEWANKLSADFLGIQLKNDLGQRIDNLIRNPKFLKALTKNSDEEILLSLPHKPHQKFALQLIPLKKNLKLLITRDITQRENLIQMRKNFIANASHELRSPLTVIAGYLEMMQEEDKLSGSMQSAILSAKDQSIRMQQIIEDMLTLSRLENSELKESENLIIDMPSVIKTICYDAPTLMSDHHHSITTNINHNLKIKGSESEIISVCSNLIHNSIRHTHNGTEILVEWKKDQNKGACLVVKDNGQGISAHHIPHLTERFYRIDEGRSRDTGGTGLGLAIVQHIIQRHGGQLFIQSSTLGKGSIFTVCIPASRVVIN